MSIANFFGGYINEQEDFMDACRSFDKKHSNQKTDKQNEDFNKKRIVRSI